MIEIRPYEAGMADLWDGIVARSRSGNFLHLRRYMDYHADRFTDRSLVIFRKGEPVAVFPACHNGSTIASHGGLTYGGLIATATLRADATLAVIDGIIAHYRALSATKLIYKAIPHVFHRYPCEEDLYALTRAGATLVRRDLSSVVDLRRKADVTGLHVRSVSRVKTDAIVLGRGNDLTAFHTMLHDRASDMGRQVTHSAAELELLASRFPDQIILHEARDSTGQLLAGVLVFDFGPTVHTQYIGATAAGRAMAALDVLLLDLVGKVYAERDYFSFGISTEQSGTLLNSGLVAQKEAFGARAVMHDFYELNLQ